MEDTIVLSPPYISFNKFWNNFSLLNGLERYGFIDSKILEDAGISVVNDRFKLIQVLRFFGFIDDKNNITDSYHIFFSSNDNFKKEYLREEVFKRYPDMLNHDLTRISTEKLHELFKRKYDVAETTIKKAVMFFINLMKCLDIPINPALTRRIPYTRVARKNKIEVKNSALFEQELKNETEAKSSIESNGVENIEVNTNEHTIKLQSGGKVTLKVSIDLFALEKNDRDFVLGLIDSLKEYNKK